LSIPCADDANREEHKETSHNTALNTTVDRTRPRFVCKNLQLYNDIHIACNKKCSRNGYRSKCL